jgi:hypothetical protein
VTCHSSRCDQRNPRAPREYPASAGGPVRVSPLTVQRVTWSVPDAGQCSPIAITASAVPARAGRAQMRPGPSSQIVHPITDVVLFAARQAIRWRTRRNDTAALRSASTRFCPQPAKMRPMGCIAPTSDRSDARHKAGQSRTCHLTARAGYGRGRGDHWPSGAHSTRALDVHALNPSVSTLAVILE